MDGVEVCVVVGKFSYMKRFKDAQDERLKRILGFCKAEGFIKVLRNIPDELFFSSHKEE